MNWYAAILDEAIEDEKRIAIATGSAESLLAVSEMMTMEAPELHIADWMLSMGKQDGMEYTPEEFSLYFTGRGPQPW
jgi:hypothetical protein